MTDLNNRDRIFRAIAAKTVALKGIAHAVGGVSDNVHLVASVPPNLALSAFISQVKGASSHMASRLVEGYFEDFQWQESYGVLTVSEVHLPVVVKYVLNQIQHHQENSLYTKLEQIE